MVRDASLLAVSGGAGRQMFGRRSVPGLGGRLAPCRMSGGAGRVFDETALGREGTARYRVVL
jgi:hypothetical protein